MYVVKRKKSFQNAQLNKELPLVQIILQDL